MEGWGFLPVEKKSSEMEVSGWRMERDCRQTDSSEAEGSVKKEGETANYCPLQISTKN